MFDRGKSNGFGRKCESGKSAKFWCVVLQHMFHTGLRPRRARNFGRDGGAQVLDTRMPQGEFLPIWPIEETVNLRDLCAS